MKQIWVGLVLAAFLFVSCTSVPKAKLAASGGNEFVGTVTAVHDGDTLLVTSEDGKHKVRLAGIDAPELAQPFGPEAKAALESRVGGKQVRVAWTTLDRYERVVGNVYFENGRWANIEMIACGMAWHYKAYSKDEVLASLEQTVQGRKLGLWKQDRPQPPWEFRKEK